MRFSNCDLKSVRNNKPIDFYFILFYNVQNKLLSDHKLYPKSNVINQRELSNK